MTDDTAPPPAIIAQHLLVVYSEQLEACRGFYAGIGAPLTREQHGSARCTMPLSCPKAWSSSSILPVPVGARAGCGWVFESAEVFWNRVITSSPTPTVAPSWSPSTIKEASTDDSRCQHQRGGWACVALSAQRPVRTRHCRVSCSWRRP
jgi:hypothetical protein